MTNPPQQPGQFGQDPYGQSGQPNQFGPQQPGQPNQQGGGGYPQGGPQPQQNWGGGTSGPGQGFGQPAPYGQFDGNQGYPNGSQPPKKKKPGPSLGLRILGIVVVGGIVALILILTNKNDSTPTAAGPSPSANNSSSANPKPSTSTTGPATPSTAGGTGNSSAGGTAATAGQASPQALADYVVKSYDAGDGKAIFNAVCPDAGGHEFTVPPQTTATLVGPVSNDGVDMSLAAPGSSTATLRVSFKNEGGSWCLSNFQKK